MNETKTEQTDYYKELEKTLDEIDNKARFQPRTGLEKTIMKNVEKIVLNNEDGDLALIDKLTKHFSEFYSIITY
jgi:hypothetical protein